MKEIGKPWKIISRHKTFEEADRERKKILEEIAEMEIKIKFSNAQSLFLLKIRK